MREKTAEELSEGDTVVRGSTEYEVDSVDDVYAEKREPSGADSDHQVHVRFTSSDDADEVVDETYQPDDIVEIAE